ncbi:hypothetical protein PIB30_011504 [Stylosanthes scabra]|uniref:Uncharacterized protein n=1 Tax=Stylosanthes scabra TaxID=79078 RepID=A0ABU6S6B3_9FABA|nr:hypothetical protein [Stylosanthes scabra]
MHHHQLSTLVTPLSPLPSATNNHSQFLTLFRRRHLFSLGSPPFSLTDNRRCCHLTISSLSPLSPVRRFLRTAPLLTLGLCSLVVALEKVSEIDSLAVRIGLGYHHTLMTHYFSVVCSNLWISAAHPWQLRSNTNTPAVEEDDRLKFQKWCIEVVERASEKEIQLTTMTLWKICPARSL